MAALTTTHLGTVELYWKNRDGTIPSVPKALVVVNPTTTRGKKIAANQRTYILADTIRVADPDDLIRTLHARMRETPNYRVAPLGTFLYAMKDQDAQKVYVDTLFEMFRSYGQYSPEFEDNAVDDDDMKACDMMEMEAIGDQEDYSAEVVAVDPQAASTLTSKIMLIKNKTEVNGTAAFVILPAEANLYDADIHKVLEQVDCITPAVPVANWKSKVQAEMNDRKMDGVEGQVPAELQQDVISWMQAYYDYERCDPAYRKKRMFEIARKHCGISPRMFVMKAGTTEYVLVTDITSVAPGDRIKYSANHLNHAFGGFLPHEKRASRALLDSLCDVRQHKNTNPHVD